MVLNIQPGLYRRKSYPYFFRTKIRLQVPLYFRPVGSRERQIIRVNGGTIDRKVRIPEAIRGNALRVLFLKNLNPAHRQSGNSIRYAPHWFPEPGFYLQSLLSA
jgi:hypothetical protein